VTCKTPLTGRYGCMKLREPRREAVHGRTRWHDRGACVVGPTAASSGHLAHHNGGIPTYRARPARRWMLAGIAMLRVRLARLLSGMPAGRSEFWRAVADSVEASFGPALSYQASVTRREDMCNLSFDFYNLTLNTSGSEPELVPVNPKATSYLAVIFPAQHVGEEAVDGTTAPPWPTPPIPACSPARASWCSRSRRGRRCPSPSRASSLGARSRPSSPTPPRARRAHLRRRRASKPPSRHPGHCSCRRRLTGPGSIRPPR
jgi:hypothetical protein